MSNTNNSAELEIIPIVFAVDTNYITVLHVTIQSIIANATPGKFYQMHILHENLTEEDIASFNAFQGDNFKIEFNNIAKQIKQYAKVMHYKYYGSNAIYYRVFIPELLPYDKVVYLDADVVLNADVAELYHADLGSNLVGGILCSIVNLPQHVNYAKRFLGLGTNDKQPCYFNSGVLVMNCAQMRQENFIEQFFDVASSFKLEVCPDQDYYNLLCYGRTVLLPLVWNKMPIPGSKQKLAEIKLVHFNVYGKPWRQTNVVYEELFWTHAKHTAMYERLLQMRDDYMREHGGDKRINTILDILDDLASHDENIYAAVQKRRGEIKIPKKIHYIWLGEQPLSQKMQDCIESWRLHCPDYEIIEWNEKNFDLDQSPLIRIALAKKNYVLAASIMRVFILNQHGGIYLDTDVKLLKPINRFLLHELFLGYESRLWLNTAIIGGVPGHPVFQKLAELCASKYSLKLTNKLSVDMWSAAIANLCQIKMNGKTRLLDHGIALYSREWFYPIHYITRKITILPNTHTVHYYISARNNDKKIRNFLRSMEWYLSSPLYYFVEKIYAGNMRHRVNALFRKLQRSKSC